MTESESLEAAKSQEKQQNDDVEKLQKNEFEQEEETEEEEEEEEELLAEDEEEEEEEASQLGELKEEQQLGESNRSEGLQENSGLGSLERAELQVEVSHQSVSITAQNAEAHAQNQPQSLECPTFICELSPTSVTQSISSAPSPTLPEQRLSPLKVNTISQPENLSKNKTVSVVNIVKTPVPDGYNWRKYGQKQVKSPRGSRSYYKCTYSDCCAKKIECSDHTGHVIEIVNKGMHSHDPPRKNNSIQENRIVSSVGPALGNNGAEQPIRALNDSDLSTSSKDCTQGATAVAERKRPSLSGSDGNGETIVKEEHAHEPEAKRRVKKGNVTCSSPLLKQGKKPKFVVHAAGDVGISGDGYRWRKYGQKMVKGNPNPRNYYRCTSAGCPVRKHIETAVDNTSAVIITYKGVHDHDMPVPKKRHGPPSAPLVAAAAPASMNNSQLKKTDGVQNQTSSTQWSVSTEGELTGAAMDLGGEKAMESARTLLSIGFEIKPC
ncbi:probable WRKY transcription factor 32 [Mangifera indica]|uniref:probable WRKY transcription factor 32 n=1 Tax=Mangifera indica TaxID=29780 RepID=UPI001CF966B1|nr:probable WRKY transcription factor 32 [Mangifera indica]